jgi:hypothetical protein
MKSLLIPINKLSKDLSHQTNLNDHLYITLCGLLFDKLFDELQTAISDNIRGELKVKSDKK